MKEDWWVAHHHQSSGNPTFGSDKGSNLLVNAKTATRIAPKSLGAFFASNLVETLLTNPF
jgi:hypothetical protein